MKFGHFEGVPQPDVYGDLRVPWLLNLNILTKWDDPSSKGEVVIHPRCGDSSSLW